MTKKWDDHRDIILSLYREQNKPLHEVRDIMIKEYGFTASCVLLSLLLPICRKLRITLP